MNRFLVGLALLATCDAIFFNSGCGCPPPPPCLPPIQLPQICLPQIQLPNLCPPPTPCCGRKKREIGDELEEEELEVVDNKICNDVNLKDIMTENMRGTAADAKMRIVEAAEAKLGGQFTVVCSSGAFSYLSTTTTYCLRTHNGLNCYAFRTDGNARRRRRL